MEIEDLGEPILTRVEFSKMKIPLIPKVSGVYILTTYFHSILYIGVSNNLQRRIIEHLSNPIKLNLTPLGKVYWLFFKQCPQKEYRRRERGWILQHQLFEGVLPYFNKIEAPYN